MCVKVKFWLGQEYPVAKNTSSWWAGLKLDKFVENKVFRARKAFLANNR